MGRLAWYAGVSTVLAGGVVISAFNQRVNFYSACVYLSQSNLCLMILINLILFIYGSLMYGLQRLCYGQLRPIEIEQLYEKAWFAITETCLAMTIFREEVGAWFLVMFVGLLTGKVWGWIGDGRVEVLEQQPPANPRLFHIRLTISLSMSIIYDLWLMKYTISTVIQQARPNMMVMFLFEFAILTTCSFATGCRYGISLIEAKITAKQTQERLLQRRREVRMERAEIVRQREAAATNEEGATTAQYDEPLPSEEDVDEMDIEVPGWEAKGQWVLTLDLFTDFIKLCIYVTFFVILFMFYGLPIHIIRDLFLTARSFTKRLAAFLRYRRATQDMNTRYEDATVDDIQREDTCIICREEMRPWSVTNPEAPPAPPALPGGGRIVNSINERSRPKKLPCGHILHLGCLKSWLERQQVCPTCRAPVDTPQGQGARAAGNNTNPAAPGAQPQLPGQQDGAGAQPPAAAPRPARRGMRMINFGPLRVGFGQANLQDLVQGPQPNQENDVAGNPRVYGLELAFPGRVQPQPQAQGTANPPGASTTLQDQLHQIEQQIVAQIHSLQITQQEVQLVHMLRQELQRLRFMRNGGNDPLATNIQLPQAPQVRQVPLPVINGQFMPLPSMPLPQVPQMQRHGARSNAAAIPSGSADLPPGVTIPDGWSLLPLQRLDGLQTAQTAGSAVTLGPAPPTATTQPDTISPMSGTYNNNLTPTINPDNRSQTSSTHSSDINTNINSTPPSVAADQQSYSNTASNTTVSHTTSNETPVSIVPSDTSLNPSTFPNWGPSQLFSGPGLALAGTSSLPSSSSAAFSTMPSPPEEGSQEGSQGFHVPVDTLSSLHASNTESAEDDQYGDNPSSRETGDAPSIEEKGKGRAATVEETIDEAEGS